MVLPGATGPDGRQSSFQRYVVARAFPEARGWSGQEPRVRCGGLWGPVRRAEWLLLLEKEEKWQGGTVGYYTTLIGAYLGIWEEHSFFLGVEIMWASSVNQEFPKNVKIQGKKSKNEEAWQVYQKYSWFWNVSGWWRKCVDFHTPLPDNIPGTWHAP